MRGSHAWYCLNFECFGSIDYKIFDTHYFLPCKSTFDRRLLASDKQAYCIIVYLLLSSVKTIIWHQCYAPSVSLPVLLLPTSANIFGIARPVWMKKYSSSSVIYVTKSKFFVLNSHRKKNPVSDIGRNLCNAWEFLEAIPDKMSTLQTRNHKTLNYVALKLTIENCKTRVLVSCITLALHPPKISVCDCALNVFV